MEKKITRLYLILLFISVRCLSQSGGVLYHGNNEMKWILILLLKIQPFIENNTFLRWQNWFHHLTCYRVETNLIMERHSCLKIWYVIIHGEIYKKKKKRIVSEQDNNFKIVYLGQTTSLKIYTIFCVNHIIIRLVVRNLFHVCSTSDIH